MATNKPLRKGKPVSGSEMIKIIMNEKLNDNDTRTFFWVYMDGKNGDKSEAALKEISGVVRVMENHRPQAYKKVLKSFQTIKLLQH